MQTEPDKHDSDAVPHFWADLRQVLRGKSRDYTKGPITRSIILLAIPMVLEMIMESLFTIADVYFVAQLGSEHVAVLGITESVMVSVFAVGIGLSLATTAIVARRVGEKNAEAARKSATQAVFLSLLMSLPIAALGLLFGKEILMLMGASPETAELGTPYITIMLSTNVILLLLFVNNAIFRGAGDAVLSMKVLWLANFINIVLDPLFIFGWGPFPEMGLTGAAVATCTGRGIGVLFQLVILYRGSGLIRLRDSKIRLDIPLLSRIFRLSLGGIMQWFVATSSWTLLVRVMAMFGENAVAGYTIGVRLVVFALLPAWGLSNAAATLVGQNLGAGNPKRAGICVWRSALLNMAFLGSVAVVFIVWAEPIVALFKPEPEVALVAADCLRIVSYSNLGLAVGLVVVQAFNGAGDTRTPTSVNLLCYWLFQIPVAYLLAKTFELGPRGVFIAIALSETMLGLLGAYLFRLGRWKDRQV
ncbi:MATE family efflux transporter [Acanthopleuribacter pedis]|uniref:Multidrug-efflux transporter n=1 Tax=Acanthopleuribacter pedis TaxID=442870 RepID=A0A8J7QL38_9BACT|nr:MATE family efflux transporter [Acanthopleuribacter pedis]MBO1323081.1 MATE family efflux transporter [Acanthopleuribacter pedis]